MVSWSLRPTALSVKVPFFEKKAALTLTASHSDIEPQFQDWQLGGAEWANA